MFAARPWVEVYTDTVELPDGRVREHFHRLVLPDFAVAVALTPERRFVMVREYKHGADAICLNAPAGRLDDAEEPLAGARRELLEETGYAADAWQPLGNFFIDGSTRGARAHLFLARDARIVAEPQLDDTEEIEVVLLDEAQVREALASGAIALMPTACALGLALASLGR